MIYNSFNCISSIALHYYKFMKQFFLLLLGFPLFFCIEVQVLAAQGYRLPFAAGKSVQITQSCVDSIDGLSCTHSGIPDIKYAIDFGCSNGDPIGAIQNGSVDLVGFENGGYGNYIKIKHSDGKYSLYAHLQEPSSLSIGTSVRSGQAIGKCGDSGNSPNGSHLHLELRPTSSYNTVPVYFDECVNNPLCKDGQVYYPQSYVSINSYVPSVIDTYVPPNYNPKPVAPTSNGNNGSLPVDSGAITPTTVPLKSVPVPSSTIGVLSAFIIGILLLGRRKLR